MNQIYIYVLGHSTLKTPVSVISLKLSKVLFVVMLVFGWVTAWYFQSSPSLAIGVTSGGVHMKPML